MVFLVQPLLGSLHSVGYLLIITDYIPKSGQRRRATKRKCVNTQCR